MKKQPQLPYALQDIIDEFHEILGFICCEPNGTEGEAKLIIPTLSRGAKLLLQLSGFGVKLKKTADNTSYWEISTEQGIWRGFLLLQALEAPRVPRADLDPELSFLLVSPEGQMYEQFRGSLSDGLLDYRKTHNEDPLLLLMHPDDYDRFIHHSCNGYLGHFEGIPIEASDAVPPLNFRFV
jgi:hypothetical protein